MPVGQRNLSLPQHCRDVLWLDCNKYNVAALDHLRQAGLQGQAGVKAAAALAGAAVRWWRGGQPFWRTVAYLALHLCVGVHGGGTKRLEHLLALCHWIGANHLICPAHPFADEASSQGLGHGAAADEAYTFLERHRGEGTDGRSEGRRKARWPCALGNLQDRL
jgi:hypothetical protein